MVVAICDDEKIFREQVVECLNAYNSEICIYEYDDGCVLIDSKKERNIEESKQQLLNSVNVTDDNYITYQIHIFKINYFNN